MRLLDINFGHVFNASGARGFFGEGYWFHRWLRPAGLDFTGATFIAKTTTLEPKAGNMPLQEDGVSPREIVPRCVVVKPIEGVALNSVGLSGPGAAKLLERGQWQERREPFLLSFMSVGDSRAKRLDELQRFVTLVKAHRLMFHAPFGLQINFSCPNVGLHQEDLIGEIGEALNIASSLEIPLIPKFNALVPVEMAVQIARHRACHAISVSNTIPWGQLPDRIDWVKLFGTSESPLAHLGGGGLSGRPLLPIVCEWIANATRCGIRVPLIGGGGILCVNDARRMLYAGASAVELGSIAFLRPWRVHGIITEINDGFEKGVWVS